MSEIALSEETETLSDIKAENINTEKFLIFSIQNKLYSFPSNYIGEVALFDAVYPLPLMPAYVLGIVNRYSVPYALFDIGILFYNTESPRNKVLFVKESIDRIAFLIDDVHGIADVQPDKVLAMERSSESDDLTDAVFASFNWNDSDILVLDINRILSRVTGGAVQ